MMRCVPAGAESSRRRESSSWSSKLIRVKRLQRRRTRGSRSQSQPQTMLSSRFHGKSYGVGGRICGW
eukprot:2433128-Prymnesium_polylepis.1